VEHWSQNIPTHLIPVMNIEGEVKCEVKAGKHVPDLKEEKTDIVLVDFLFCPEILATNGQKALKPVSVRWMTCTLMKTPYGPGWLHIYKSSVNDKRHLALVFDPVQQQVQPTTASICSLSLKARWSEKETCLDRTMCGAEPDRYCEHSDTACCAPGLPPLVCLHSQCFAGETFRNGHCDCSAQMDKALRALAHPPNTNLASQGILLYLPQ
jgi:GTP cyclohydrolase II